MPFEVQYVVLFFGILVFPKFLIRFRIPTAFTCLFLGGLCGHYLGWFQANELLTMLSKLGITSLFLFAGMEVDTESLKSDSKALSAHIFKMLFLICLVTFGAVKAFDLNLRPAVILSLALLAPSTGFILNTLPQYNIGEREQKWIKSKAISSELIAILLMFVTTQSQDLKMFGASLAVVIAMLLLLPLVFRFFLRYVVPHAPGSEVSFIILLALGCGMLTTYMGTYYLVGAFIVGITAGRFRHFATNSDSQNIFKLLAFFFSFFVPFYFFKAGSKFPVDLITFQGLMYGVIALAVFLPLRVGSVYLSIWFFMKESWGQRKAIALPLLPTLIFGLVMESIARERFNLPPYLSAALIVYTVGASILPWFFLRKLPPELYDNRTL